MRNKFKTDHNASPQYDHRVRMQMRNSLSLSSTEVSRLIDEGVLHVIRIKMPTDEVVGLVDMIRGGVNFNTSQVDDKVLLKGDGMPTYHLAVVVDDYLMLSGAKNGCRVPRFMCYCGNTWAGKIRCHNGHIYP